MRAVTSAEMRSIEERAVSEAGLDIPRLMEKAGKALAEEVRRLSTPNRNVVVISGKGNNGGDGFVAARLLKEAGYHISLFHPSPDDMAPAARQAFDRLPDEMAKAPLDRVDELTRQLTVAGAVVDALLGFGLSGGVHGAMADVVKAVNQVDKPVISADVPSGVSADDGKVEGECVRATTTVTFTCPKIGLIVYPGAGFAGRVVVADIGIPQRFVEEGSDVVLGDRALLRSVLPVYDPLQNKWNRGGVLVVGGSSGMEGAPILVARGAMRSGAGIVGVACPASVASAISTAVVEAIALPMAEAGEESGGPVIAGRILEAADRYKALVVGPGLGRAGHTMDMVRRLVAESPIPVVLDADGLFPFAGNLDGLATRGSALVITPHSGELGRLMDVDAAEIDSDRIGWARKASDRFGGAVVLKGARTLIAAPSKLVLNTTGNPGLATAGTGDVLAGIIGSLIAQGVEEEDAASLGVYLHGKAGDLVAADLTEYSVVAGDLPSYLPQAFKHMIDG
ncbi:MAG: NAD(P)H-hydrate dehydratase [Candidatus Aquicultorales bacterium]